jgi:hypothetical protein
MMDRSTKKKVHFIVVSLALLSIGIFGSAIYVTSTIFSINQSKQNVDTVLTSKYLERHQLIIKKRNLSLRQRVNKVEILKLHGSYKSEIEGRSYNKSGYGLIARFKSKMVVNSGFSGSSIDLNLVRITEEIDLKQSEYLDLKKKQSEHVIKQWFLSGMLLFLLTTTLLSFKRLNYVKWPAWSTYLNCYLPDEVIGELWALHKQLTDSQKTIPQIRNKIFRHVLESIWAFHVQIRIDNLSLPAGKRRTDD